MNDSNATVNYVILAIVAIVAVVALVFFMQPRDEPGTRLGEAVDELADGVEDAANELKPQKTTGEKIGDAIDDMGDNVKDATE